MSVTVKVILSVLVHFVFGFYLHQFLVTPYFDLFNGVISPYVNNTTCLYKHKNIFHIMKLYTVVLSNFDDYADDYDDYICYILKDIYSCLVRVIS